MQETHVDGFEGEALSLEDIKILKRTKEPYKAGEFDSLVKDMAGLMKVNVEFLDEEVPGNNFAESVIPWLAMVDFKNGVGEISPKVKANDGKEAFMLDFNEENLPKSADEEVSAKQALSALVLAEAKLTVIKELMAEVYPTLAEEAEEYLEVLKEKKMEVLGEYGYLPMKDMVEKMVPDSRNCGISYRRKLSTPTLVFGSLVIVSLALSACSTVNAATIEGSTPTSNIPTVTEVVQATPMTPPVETPVVAPTLAPVEIPTEVPTEVPTEAPRGFLIGENLPTTLEEAKVKNFVEWDNLESEMAKLLEAERKVTVWGPDEISLTGKAFDTFETPIYTHNSSIFLRHERRKLGEDRYWVKSYVYTTREVGGVEHELHIFGVESILPGNPGVVINLHFGYEPGVVYEEVKSIMSYEDYIDRFGVEDVFKNIVVGNKKELYLSPDIYGGELKDSFSENPIVGGVVQLVNEARTQGYEELWKKAFIDRKPLSKEEIEIMESVIFPARAFGFRTEEKR